jgi:hypothetical protein
VQIEGAQTKLVEPFLQHRVKGPVQPAGTGIARRYVLDVNGLAFILGIVFQVVEEGISVHRLIILPGMTSSRKKSKFQNTNTKQIINNEY